MVAISATKPGANWSQACILIALLMTVVSTIRNAIIITDQKVRWANDTVQVKMQRQINDDHLTISNHQT